MISDRRVGLEIAISGSVPQRTRQSVMLRLHQVRKANLRVRYRHLNNQQEGNERWKGKRERRIAGGKQTDRQTDRNASARRKMRKGERESARERESERESGESNLDRKKSKIQEWR